MRAKEYLKQGTTFQMGTLLKSVVRETGLRKTPTTTIHQGLECYAVVVSYFRYGFIMKSIKNDVIKVELGRQQLQDQVEMLSTRVNNKFFNNKQKSQRH
jgi:hypothetical protein